MKIDDELSLAQRSVQSVSWNIISSITRVFVLFFRSVLLARLLPKEAFGIFATASVIVGITVVIPRFGMGSAFLHRSKETEDVDAAASTHFILKSIFTLGWALTLIILGLVFFEGQTRIALVFLVLTSAGIEITQTPKIILFRKVNHRRWALIQSVSAVLSTIVALYLAWRGETIWALLSTNLVNLLVSFTGLYLWRPVWRPSWTYKPSIIKYFLSFGSKNFLSAGLLQILDQIDDLWTRIYLGNIALADYSRAFTFATYPRRILALPVNIVAAGTYAELKGDRLRLSKAFFRSNALLIRVGFFLAGIFALVAPEFIRILLTEKWISMLTTFRLMLVFTLLDPIKITVANLFVAVGKPEVIVRARFIQLIVLVIGLYTLGSSYGISGVALAVDGMLVVGMAILLNKAKDYVDFSLKKLFMWPAISLVSSMTLARLAIHIPGVLGSDWRTGFVKTIVYLAIYIGSLFLFERQYLPKVVSMVKRGF